MIQSTSTEILPSALEEFTKIQQRISGRQLVLFLDYDGTLTPIVPHPEDALLSSSMRQLLIELASHYPVSVISGRDLADVHKKVAIEGIYYSGSHGFEIVGPHDLKEELPEAQGVLLVLKKAAGDIEKAIQEFKGAQIEKKKYSIAIHYRNVDPPSKQKLKEQVAKLGQNYPELKLNHGKEVLDLVPAVDWNKGKAVLWLLDHMALKKPLFSIYIGDDLTDEDVFKVMGENGVGIVVRENPRKTYADYALNNPQEVEKFLSQLVL